MELLTKENLTIVLGAALALSEALSLIPSVKSNGIFQAVFNGLKTLAGKE